MYNFCLHIQENGVTKNMFVFRLFQLMVNLKDQSNGNLGQLRSTDNYEKIHKIIISTKDMN
jgi:hypothetical protein